MSHPPPIPADIHPAPLPRVILHVDMDAFFASVAQLDDPKLRGKPVIVGGRCKRGVVTSASYEARTFGVKSGVPVYEALAACPQAIVVPGSFERYRTINRQLVTIWQRFAPVVEVMSIDEAYLDLTGCEALLGDPVAVARRMQAAVLSETGLPCSVGIASNKLLAKVASDRHKPRGLTVVPVGEEAAWLADLKIGALHGIGPATTRRLAAYGLYTAGQLAAIPPEQLERVLGPGSGHLVAMARGLDTRPVRTHSEAKSIGAETTFRRDLADGTALSAIARDLVQEVAYRARRAGVFARTITIKMRYSNFETQTRAHSLPVSTHDDDVLFRTVCQLLEKHRERGRPMRLLGVSISSFSPASQLSFLPLLAPTQAPSPEQGRALHAALDAIRERHGLFAISRGTHLERPTRRRHGEVVS